MKEKRLKKTYSQGAIDGVEIWVDTEKCFIWWNL